MENLIELLKQSMSTTSNELSEFIQLPPMEPSLANQLIQLITKKQHSTYKHLIETFPSISCESTSEQSTAVKVRHLSESSTKLKCHHHMRVRHYGIQIPHPKKMCKHHSSVKTCHVLENNCEDTTMAKMVSSSQGIDCHECSTLATECRYVDKTNYSRKCRKRKWPPAQCSSDVSKHKLFCHQIQSRIKSPFEPSLLHSKQKDTTPNVVCGNRNRNTYSNDKVLCHYHPSQ